MGELTALRLGDVEMIDDFFLSQIGGGLGNEAVEQLVSNYAR